MNRQNLKKLIIDAIVKNRPIRVMFSLSILFFAATLVLFFYNNSIEVKIKKNDVEIQEIQSRINDLNDNVLKNINGPGGEGKSKEKAFASYDEIVPFISLLEDLFGLLDEDSNIIIRDKRDRIYANRYADYEVNVDVSKNQDFFFVALKELHESKYISRIMNFNMNYSSFNEENNNKLKSVNFTIRLFFE